MSLSGNVVILKRDVSEICINNYNVEWILAWDGNIDLQFCLDFFAVITYITDYYSKTESKVTDMLVEACKQNKDAPLQIKMSLLSQIFLTHRQMGESEAYYRMLPGLHLKDSNIKTIFVQAGFRCNRHKYMYKVESSSKQKPTKVEYIIDGRESLGALVEKTSIHELYQNRPVYLNEMCLAQFSIMYQSVPHVSRTIKFTDGISDTFGKKSCHKIVYWSADVDKHLPKYIIINVHEQRYMRLRTYPAILRRHHYNETANPHEFMYSELVLFCAWKNENELYDNDLNKCITKWSQLLTNSDSITQIDYVKGQLFPNSCTIQSSSEEQSRSGRLQHIADTLDATVQQEDADDFEEGFRIDDEHASRHLEDLYVNPQSKPHEHIFKVTNFTNEKREEMLSKVRQLVSEQKIPFNIVIKYAKDVRMILDHMSGDTLPLPPTIGSAWRCWSGKIYSY